MNQLSSLQLVRAIAAIMVVVFHINIFILPARLYDGDNAFRFLNIGYSGVEFFFALSGFIMVYIHQKDFNHAERLHNFMKKRVIRLVPLYWLILGALVIASALVPTIGPEQKPDFLELTQNFLLAPSEKTMLLEVAWTLRHEVLFYAVFGLLIYSAQIGRTVMTFWFVGCATALLFADMPFPASFLFSAYNLIFLAGMLAAKFWNQLSPKAAVTCVAGGLVFFIAIVAGELYRVLPIAENWRTVGLGVGAATTIAGLVAMESHGMFKSPRVLSLVGDSSYALYLIHLPVLTATAPIIAKLGLNQLLPPQIMVVLLAIGCVVAGLITHFIIEKPLMRASGRLAEKYAPRTSSASAKSSENKFSS